MFNLVKNRYLFLIISLIVIIPGTLSLIFKGLNVGLDFAGGANVEIGGKRNGVFLEPTVLTHTTADMKVNCEEVFAPLVTVTPYTALDEAIKSANASPYGLQAGVFTTNLQTMFKLHAELDVGAVNGNDIPGFRIDRLPYGGAKASGLGREGVRYAIEEMTEQRVLTLKLD